jgi:hypothetical protein
MAIYCASSRLLVRAATHTGFVRAFGGVYVTSVALSKMGLQFNKVVAGCRR